MAKQNPLTRSKHKKALGCYRAGRLDEAKEIYLQIASKDRTDDSAWTMLGIIHAMQNDFIASKDCLGKALTLNPSNFDANYNLGLVLHNMGLLEDAIASYRTTLVLRPDQIDTQHNMGVTYTLMDELALAQQCYQRILQQVPENAAALTNLANVLTFQGNAEPAIAHYRQSLIAKPLASTHSNLLLSLHYPASYDPESTFREHQSWAAKHTEGVNRYATQWQRRVPGKKLRIGYVTPDLRGHSVTFFFEPILTHHDHDQFEIYCYLDLSICDNTTTRLLESAGIVRNIKGQSDESVATMVRDDQIDILVDLVGHTAKNRLLVFARKPAPIQITYLGYPDTTGMQAMDYRLTDEWADPPGMTEHLHTEKLVRIKDGFLCFAPPAESPPVASSPFAAHGYVTFGSFNVLTKITPQMLDVWARILVSVPNARLLIKNRQLIDKTLQERLYARFEQHGVGRERIKMLGRTSKEEHMATYSKVDIALDSFPYHGTTTTCDTLWMGIPVITLAGKTHVARVGVSLLTRVGLSEFISMSEQEYLELAVRLANSPEKLGQLRHKLRDMVQASGLVDGASFTQKIEAIYRELWQTCCINRRQAEQIPAGPAS